MSLIPVTIAYALAEGGQCQKLALSTVAVQSAAIIGNLVEITPSVDCYARIGDNPTATANGTDHFLVANASRLFTINRGKKISFVTELLTGSVRIAEVVIS